MVRGRPFRSRLLCDGPNRADYIQNPLPREPRVARSPSPPPPPTPHSSPSLHLPHARFSPRDGAAECDDACHACGAAGCLHTASAPAASHGACTPCAGTGFGLNPELLLAAPPKLARKICGTYAREGVECIRTHGSKYFHGNVVLKKIAFDFLIRLLDIAPPQVLHIWINVSNETRDSRESRDFFSLEVPDFSA